MRLRIAIELLLHQDLYMSDEYLSQGLLEGHPRLTAQKIAHMSEIYTDQHLTHSVVKKIYLQEVQAVLKPGTHMGMWQLCAMVSVLGRSLFSVYPNKGNPAIRRDLHRMVLPRSGKPSTVDAMIMWTSCRGDMNQQHWVPNHFTVLLPLDLKPAPGSSSTTELVEEGEEDTLPPTEAPEDTPGPTGEAEAPVPAPTGEAEAPPGGAMVSSALTREEAAASSSLLFNTCSTCFKA
jgi:hypothetical protein